MTNKLKEIPDEANNPFVDLRWLLSMKVTSVAAIATAIETFGIYTWDKYGRYKNFDKTTPEAAHALSLLGYIHQYENNHQPGDISEQHPLDQSEGVDDDYYKYGWAKEVLPDFFAIKNEQGEVPRPPHKCSQREVDATLRIVGALLEYIDGTVGQGKHPSFTNESKLIEFLDQKYDGIEGLSQSNLSRKFPTARRNLN